MLWNNPELACIYHTSLCKIITWRVPKLSPLITSQNILGFFLDIHVIFLIIPHDAHVHVTLHHGHTWFNHNNQQKIISCVEYINTHSVRSGRTNLACSKGQPIIRKQKKRWCLNAFPAAKTNLKAKETKKRDNCTHQASSGTSNKKRKLAKTIPGILWSAQDTGWS